jgi:hypothetical protein
MQGAAITRGRQSAPRAFNLFTKTAGHVRVCYLRAALRCENIVSVLQIFGSPDVAEGNVHRQHSWDKLGRLKKGVFLAHRSVRQDLAANHR